MSEITTNQEQPEMTAPSPEQTVSPETDTSVMIGGQTIERNADGTTTETVFPVTSVQTPETIPEQTTDANGNTLIPPLVIERELPEAEVAAAETTQVVQPEAANPETPSVATEAIPALVVDATTNTVGPVKGTETEVVETVAEVGVPQEPINVETSSAEVGLAGTLALGAATLVTKLRRKK